MKDRCEYEKIDEQDLKKDIVVYADDTDAFEGEKINDNVLAKGIPWSEEIPGKANVTHRYKRHN